MGASNFHYVNASRVFSICESFTFENEDGEEETYYPDSDDFECEIDNVRSILKSAGELFCGNETRSREELRSYPTTFIGTIYRRKTFGDVEVEVEAHCYARSGYYAGACLDYEMEISIDGNEVDEIDGNFQDAYSDMNEGMLKIQARNAEKWANNTISELADVAEGVFAQCSTQYTKVATASNGEAFYHKIR